MTDATMFQDLLAAQKEMPSLQKTAINPHFKNRYVPLDELIPAVMPILHKHNLVLLQCPTIADGHPALRYTLMHVSGECIESTMLLQTAKDDPQAQGSAITYARRYSILSMLGLTADVDDDAEASRTQQRPAFQRPPAAPQRPVAGGRAVQQGNPPSCPVHGVCKFQKGGISQRSGKPYDSFWSCQDRDCSEGYNGKNWSIDAVKWAAMEQAEHNDEPPMLAADYDENMPNE